VQLPLLTWAVSALVGRTPPLQLAVLLQFPLLPLTQVLVALAEGPNANNKVTTIKTPTHLLILISSYKKTLKRNARYFLKPYSAHTEHSSSFSNMIVTKTND
jgi:hypothetical protein